MWKYDHSALIVFLSLLLLVDKETGVYTCGRFQLAEITGIKPTTNYHALLRLQKAKIVTLMSDNKKTTVRICNWKKYQGNDDSTSDNKVTTNRQQSDTKQELRIKNKENSTNVELATYGKPEINKMFNYWQEKTGVAITARATINRRACNNLIKKYGDEKLRKLIEGVAMAQGDQYAPRIADFAQLQSKVDELIVWGKRKTTKKGTIKI